MLFRTCLLCAALTPAAWAQQIYAGLAGSVEDPAGATLQAAAVRLTALDRPQSRMALTGAVGRFRFAYLPAGDYELQVSRPQFATAVRRLTLRAGETADIHVRMQLAARSQTVEVEAQAAPVDSETAESASSVDPREIQSLPLNGRNYLDLALLVPGVSRTNTGTAQRFAETSAVPGTGISVSGQRNLANSFLVDGLSANDDAAGLAGTFYSEEVVREFRVVASGGMAEYGRASAGVVSIVTRSGTNSWHGGIYGFLRNQRLDARNPLAAGKDPLTQTQYGVTAGGPLQRDRWFVFSNFEQTRQNAAGFVTVSPAAIGSIVSTLDAVRYPGPIPWTGEFTTGFDTSNGFLRVDHPMGGANLLALRYSVYDVASPNARTAGGLSTVSRGTALGDRDQTLAVNELASLSPGTVNELRAQFTRSRLDAPVNDPLGPAVNISGVANFGTATVSPTARYADVWELNDSLSATRGAHSLKAGVDLLFDRVTVAFPGARQGVYTFGSLTAFQAGRYITFQQAFGAPSQFVPNANPGAFVEEQWRPSRQVSVNAGLRYDLQLLPGGILTDRRKLAPRLGIAFSPGDRRTVIRASAGLFYDRIPLRAVSNALQRDGTKYAAAVLSFSQAGAPVFPEILPAFPAGLPVSITTMDRRIRDPYALQAGLEIQRELGPGTSLTVGYRHLRGMHLVIARNLNVPADPAAPNLGRPNPRYANISQYGSAGDSYYDGMTVSLTHRIASRAAVRISYTLSKAIDDAGNFFFSTPQNNFDLRDDRGLSDNDQRHRIAASGWANAGGFELGYIFSYGSPLPFNIQTGTDRNLDTNVNDRPPGVGRNTGVGFDAASLDLRLSRTFRCLDRLRLQALAESFNTLNRPNWQLPNNIVGPSLGRATAAGDPRQLQLGLRATF